MAEIKIEEIKPNHKTTYNNGAKIETIPKDAKEPVKKILSKDKIVSSKKPFSKRILSLFFGDDITDYKSYFIHDVLIPGCKSFAWDLLESTVFSDVTRSKTSYRGSRNIIDYARSYRGRYSEPSSRYKKKKNDGYEENGRIDPRNVILRNRRDAEEVVDYLQRRIEDCGSVSVAEFLSTMDLESRWTDNDWGWTDPNDIGLKKVSGGWLIDVAEMEQMD